MEKETITVSYVFNKPVHSFLYQIKTEKYCETEASPGTLPHDNIFVWCYKTVRKSAFCFEYQKFSPASIAYIHSPATLLGTSVLVKGLTPFCLLNCLNSSWCTFNKVLETFLRDFGPYWHDSITQLLQIRCGCTSIMGISRSTTSWSCSVGLRSGDCGGLWSTVSLSCSPNQFEMIWA